MSKEECFQNVQQKMVQIIIVTIHGCHENMLFGGVTAIFIFFCLVLSGIPLKVESKFN
jgi:hypothetical protein